MIYQIKISLKDIRPPIWRRILVDGNISLYKLHFIIQTVMGWDGYHLHEFELDGDSFGALDDDQVGYDGFDAVLNEKKFTLAKLIDSEKTRILYSYDFGDDWQHELLIEKIGPAEPGVKYPVCIKGKRACPPEDCGGPWGYADLLEAISNPDNPEHDELIEWAGDFEPELFDIDQINRALKKIR